jgi:hypothetical protein
MMCLFIMMIFIFIQFHEWTTQIAYWSRDYAPYLVVAVIVLVPVLYCTVLYCMPSGPVAPISAKLDSDRPVLVTPYWKCGEHARPSQIWRSVSKEYQVLLTQLWLKIATRFPLILRFAPP